MRSRTVWIDGLSKYRGQFGKGFCGYCGRPLPKPRRLWCSDNCIELMNLETLNWGTLRYEFLRENFECVHCGKQKPILESEFWGWTVDHIIPISLGGPEFDEANLQLLCPECNKTKTAKDMKLIALQRRNEKEQDRYISDITEFNKIKKLYEFYGNEQNTRKSDQGGL